MLLLIQKNKKNLVRIKASNSINASMRKHKNQINHYNKQRRVLMANSTVCQSLRTTKPMSCDQRRLRSACASAQSAQSFCCSHLPSKPPGYPKRNKQEPLPYWVVVQADLSLCLSHMYYCRVCRELA